MTRLFDAYFRVAGELSPEALTGTILPLDLPKERKRASVDVPEVSVTLPTLRPAPAAPLGQADQHRYYFYAKFTQDNGWVVQAALKPEHRVMAITNFGNIF